MDSFERQFPLSSQGRNSPEFALELDRIIQNAAPGAPRNDTERRLWILNDEGLYNWARSEGVKV